MGKRPHPLTLNSPLGCKYMSVQRKVDIRSSLTFNLASISPTKFTKDKQIWCTLEAKAQHYIRKVRKSNSINAYFIWALYGLSILSTQKEALNNEPHSPNTSFVGTQPRATCVRRVRLLGAERCHGDVTMATGFGSVCLQMLTL